MEKGTLPNLVYGVADNNLIIATEQMANECANLWYAIEHAQTFADFIEMTSRETFEYLVLDILTVLGHEALFPQYLAGEDLSNYITDLHLPMPEDAFSVDLLPGYEEGEFVPNLQQEILAWLPEEMMSAFGEIEYDDRFGFRYLIKPEKEQLVVASLRALGFNINSNLLLIKKAINDLD